MNNDNKINKFKQFFSKNESSQNYTNIKTENNELLNYYTSIVNNHPDFIFIFSNNAEIITSDNKRVSSFFGKTINTLKDFQTVLTEPTYKILSDVFKQTLSGQSEKCMVETVINNNQKSRLALTLIPITIDHVVEGVFLSAIDVSNQIILTEQLESHKNHLKHAQQIAKIGSWEYLIENDHLFCSENFYRIFGLEPDLYMHMGDPYTLVHPDDYEHAYQKINEAIKFGKNYTNQFRIYHGKTNEIKYIKVHAEVLFENQKPYKIIGVIRDVTQQIELENQIIEQNENYKKIFNNLSSGIWVRDASDGSFVFASKGLESILDIPISNLYDNPDTWYEMIHPDSVSQLDSAIKKVESGESLQTIYKFISGSGKIKWLLEEVVPEININGEISYVFGLITDITQEMELKAQLDYLANYDALTGLPNQKSLFEQLDHMCKYDESFAVLCLDLDRFNIINDSLGYSIGDQALKFIADNFGKLMPQAGYLARLSSNDFIMIYKNYEDKNNVYQLAQNIINKISEPFIIQGYEINISTSIGITFFPEEGKEKNILLENAHTALYQAKKEGRNTYQLSSHLADISSYKKYVLDRDMRKAIINEEFELYFQPQVEPKHGKLYGAEALIRWNHKEWGMISPGEFIPLAEENHMINTITDWVIEKVCQYLYEWKEKGLPLKPIAINIPPIRFMKTDLFDFVKAQIEKYQIDPQFLEFEITENTIVNSEIGTYSIIQRLKELGIRIAIDDFGTGYASLASIRQFKPDTIKIDKLFIQSINYKNEMDNAIISATLHLGKLLELNIVAEGVEELEQLNFLKQIDCDIIQGYLFSKPVKIDQFEKILVSGYLKPQKSNTKQIIEERRKFFRLEFPFPIPGNLSIVELNGKSVQLGKTPILIRNISLGGLNILSNLKLPINMDMKFHISFTLLDEEFELNGELRWINEEFAEVYSYGVPIKVNQLTENRLASIINKLSTIIRNNEKIPNTEFIYEDAHTYFRRNKF